MILPSKHLPQDRALLTVGAHILTFLGRPKTVSALWEELNKLDDRPAATTPRRITYDWFLLALDLLYSLGTIELNNGLVARRTA
ncbi:ABC-three component system middle component 6 [Steroidobacter agaridevorans]|uniref:ABC-three component system middle component 6 n=1 Tax=Steroidobacter agaridevorans TaxID=2695856 RepID=UPI00137B3E91|nr:ABC-three component system middle component 6 [Steroidobacter agaridevorans]